MMIVSFFYLFFCEKIPKINGLASVILLFLFLFLFSGFGERTLVYFKVPFFCFFYWGAFILLSLFLLLFFFSSFLPFEQKTKTRYIHLVLKSQSFAFLYNFLYQNMFRRPTYVFFWFFFWFCIQRGSIPMC
ncbi:hypothetical protein BZA77DRAFT_322604 [Pyronema omphalodes]|nr:hypothetical protein BZA77DRAFT_322604 [Pyronema omphalodes]